MNIKRAIGKISRDGNDGQAACVGTAWLVSPRWIVTCWHVINDVYGQATHKMTIDVDFPAAGQSCRATFDPKHADEACDIALLEVVDGLSQIEPLPSSDLPTDLRVALRWSTWGFPTLDPEGITISGSIVDTTVRLSGTGRGLQLDIAQGNGEGMGGLSGAPILCAGFVCGFVSDCPPGSNARTIYGRPMHEIFERFGRELGELGQMPAATLATGRVDAGKDPLLSGPLLNGLHALWQANEAAGVPVLTYHKLLLVKEIAPDYFDVVFDSVERGLSSGIEQWLRRSVEKGAFNAERKPGPLEPFEHDRTLVEARAISSLADSRLVDAKLFLLALLSDQESNTIKELRNAIDNKSRGGFNAMVAFAKGFRPGQKVWRTDIEPPDL